jgi:hypothetical protein
VNPEFLIVPREIVILNFAGALNARLKVYKILSYRLL